MKILITGGSGYLATELAKSFSKSHEVTLVGRAVSRPDITSNVKYIQIDWNRQESIELLCLEKDVVIHASGMNSSDSQLDPLSAEKVNGYFTKVISQASKKAGVKKFLYFSTVHVYSNTLNGVFNEESPTRNTGVYASTHVLGENFALDVADERFKVIVIRLGNIFGLTSPCVVTRENISLHNFIIQAIETKKIVLESPAGTWRNFVPLHRLVGLVEKLTLDNPIPVKSGIYNATWPNSHSLDQITALLALRMNKILGIKPIIKFGKPDEIDAPTLEFSSRVNSLISENPNHEFNWELDNLARLLHASLKGQSNFDD